MITIYKRELRDNNNRLTDFREVKLSLVEDGSLTMECCDINETASETYSSDGVEFILVLKPIQVYKLCSALKVDLKNRDIELMKTLQNKFHGEHCFDKFKEFCDKNTIPYEFQTW